MTRLAITHELERFTPTFKSEYDLAPHKDLAVSLQLFYLYRWIDPGLLALIAQRIEAPKIVRVRGASGEIEAWLQLDAHNKEIVTILGLLRSGNFSR